MDELLYHTFLKMKFTELQEACRSTDVAARLSIEDVTDFKLARVSAPVAGNVFSNEALRRTAQPS